MMMSFLSGWSANHLPRSLPWPVSIYQPLQALLQPLPELRLSLLLLCPFCFAMADRGLSSWEGWAAHWSSIGERPADGDALEPEIFDYDDVSPGVAGEEFVAMLCFLKVSGVMSAKMCCVLAWWAAKAGATGEAAKLGMRPDKKQTGAYSKHFDT